MSKNLKIGIAVLVLVIVAVIGYLVFKRPTPSSVGINDSLTNETGKEGSTTLDSDKVLVLYFSQSGNTQKLAKLISEKVGGDFVRIETVQTYPTEYNELTAFAKKEKEDNIKPELKELNTDMSKYDTVFIGYPIWWYQMPMPLYTLFDTYDFDGKTIVPFNTHEGSGESGTYDDIKKLEPNAKVLKGLPIRGGATENDQTQTVEEWLKDLGFIN